MTCTSCPYQDAPLSVRQVKCIECSKKEYSSHRFNCNELSNAGQCFESLDNHNASYEDDRDIVSQLRQDYRRTRHSDSASDTRHPSEDLSAKIRNPRLTEDVYDLIKDFLYDLTDLDDLSLCLFFSQIRREEKSAFARRHGVKLHVVNSIYWSLIKTSRTLANFIMLTNGTLDGMRGRKPAIPRSSPLYGTQRKKKRKNSAKPEFGNMGGPVQLGFEF